MYSGTYAAGNPCISAGCNDPLTGSYLSQNLATDPSQLYSLSFAYNSYSGGGGTQLNVYWNGALVDYVRRHPDGLPRVHDYRSHARRHGQHARVHGQKRSERYLPRRGGCGGFGPGQLHRRLLLQRSSADVWNHSDGNVRRKYKRGDHTRARICICE